MQASVKGKALEARAMKLHHQGRKFMHNLKRACTALVAGFAVVSVVGLSAVSASASTARSKPDATPACSSNCFDLSSLLLKRGTIQNAYVPGDLGVGGKVGQDINLNTGSNSHPNEDFTGAEVGTLANFCASVFNPTGIIPANSYVCITYPHFYPVFESDWSPYGNQSDFCTGAALPVFSGENVTLRSCGDSAGTLWVGDLANQTTWHGHLYTPWVNGANSNFSHPLTLQVDPGTVKPVNQLKLATLNTLTGNVSPDGQEFTLTPGPVA
jgi:hypothetical protein